jgi:hypothetical protein
MRFAERFLVAFAFISMIMRLWGSKDGPTLEIIALPALALFYIFAMPFLVLAEKRNEAGRVQWGRIGFSIFCGLAVAYCIISLLLYTLGWEIGKADMLENCSILLGLLIVADIIGWKRSAAPYRTGLALRSAILLGVIGIISLLPLPEIGSLSRGAL